MRDERDIAQVSPQSGCLLRGLKHEHERGHASSKVFHLGRCAAENMHCSTVANTVFPSATVDGDKDSCTHMPRLRGATH